MDICRFLLALVIVESFVAATDDPSFISAESQTVFLREKRQIGNLRNAIRNVKRRINNLGHSIDRLVIPGVQYAAEKIRDNVAPSIANTVLEVTNKVVLSTAEGIQKSAQFFSNEVAPVLEDTVVEMSNAALPVVNKGIDAVGTGLSTGVNAVSKTTSDGFKRFREKVLGEQRHNRIKKIANNLSINFNNSINNLAGAIKKVTVDDYGSNPHYDYETQNSDNTNFEENSNHNSKLHRPLFFLPNTHPPYDRYQSKYHVYYNGYDQNTDKSTLSIIRNMSIPQAFRKIVSDTAYTLSMQFLGPNLTEAVAPIARSVSSVIGQSIPSVPIRNTAEESRLQQKLRSCTTPHGGKGYCQDLSDCPDLVLKLSVLRKSICFKALFSPGVCCPDVGQLQKLRDAQRTEAEKLIQAQTARPQTSLAENQLLLSQQRPVQNPYQSSFGTAYPGLTQQQQQLLLLQGFQHPLSPNALYSALNLHLLTTPEPSIYVSDLITRDNVIINRNSQNNNYECGVQKVPRARVVGGEESAIGEWPWTAAIYLHGEEKTEFWCGGSLISEDYILTAAHCTKDAKENTFEPEQFTVHLGDYSIFNLNDDKVSRPEIYRVRHINPHPSFKRQGYFNDIALIKLSRSVEFSPYILPVCLPPPALERSHLDALVGQMPSIIGYGSTAYDGPQSNTLRDVQLPIWKNGDCDKAYFQPITDIFLCAGYIEGGKDACQGDSGGPMQLFFEDRWVQLGIVSFGNRCAEPGYPGVYTRITHFVPWIKENLR